MIQLHDPVTVPPGFQGVVTLLAGEPPKDPNVVLVEPGERGVQKAALPPGTYFLNPYAYRVSLVDCRSKRFDLGERPRWTSSRPTASRSASTAPSSSA